MDAERQRRIGENEALFRHVNERIEDVNRAFSELTQVMEIVCECGDSTCIERINVPLPDYERVRSDSALFLVIAGHEIVDVEKAVEDHGHWVVVRKEPGIPARVAAETDPRAG